MPFNTFMTVFSSVVMSMVHLHLSHPQNKESHTGLEHHESKEMGEQLL